MMAVIMEAMTVVLRGGDSASVLHVTKMIKDMRRKSLQHKIPFPPNGTKRKRKAKCYTQILKTLKKLQPVIYINILHYWTSLNVSLMYSMVLNVAGPVDTVSKMFTIQEVSMD